MHILGIQPALAKFGVMGVRLQFCMLQSKSECRVDSGASLGRIGMTRTGIVLILAELEQLSTTFTFPDVGPSSVEVGPESDLMHGEAAFIELGPNAANFGPESTELGAMPTELSSTSAWIRFRAWCCVSSPVLGTSGRIRSQLPCGVSSTSAAQMCVVSLLLSPWYRASPGPRIAVGSPWHFGRCPT